MSIKKFSTKLHIIYFFYKKNIFNKEVDIHYKTLESIICTNDLKELTDILINEGWLIQTKDSYYLDPLVFKWRTKYKFVYYFGILMLILLFILIAQINHMRFHT